MSVEWHVNIDIIQRPLLCMSRKRSAEKVAVHARKNARKTSVAIPLFTEKVSKMILAIACLRSDSGGDVYFSGEKIFEVGINSWLLDSVEICQQRCQRGRRVHRLTSNRLVACD